MGAFWQERGIMTAPLNIIARQSPLSLLQVGEAWKRLALVFDPDTTYEVIPAVTIGDVDQLSSLTDPSIPSDFFTRELDIAVVNCSADLAIHSAKDLPEELHPDLVIAALFPAQDIRDAMVYGKGVDPSVPPKVIGTSSPRREAHILKQYPDAEIKAIRGTIQRRIEQADAGDYDAVIIAACALHRLRLDDRIDEYLDYETAPNQGRLAITVHRENTDLIQRLKAIDVRRTAGLVALIGCPADLSLLPARSRRYLDEADLILYDRLIPEGLIDPYLEKAESVGKKGHEAGITQADIHRRLLVESEKGKLVVRLHGGDPGILGHLGETLEFLADWQIRADVLPAVTAAQLTASHARAPLTHRHEGRSITYLTGHAASTYYADGLPGPSHGNLAIYMGVQARESIRNELLKAGWPNETPVVAGERIGHSDEAVHSFTLSQLADGNFERPTTFLVGPNCVPGRGYTLFTGSNPDLFLRHGPILHLPFIRLEALGLEERVALVKQELGDSEGLIFPSRIAVKVFMEALLSYTDVRALAAHKILAVGPSTAKELMRYGLRADAAPDSFGGVAALARDLAKGQSETFSGRYLYPCSDASPQAERVDALKQMGITLHPSVFYRNHRETPEQLPRLVFRRVLFSSGSTVKSYFAQFPEELKADRDWLAVGSSTKRVLEGFGLNATIPAEFGH